MSNDSMGMKSGRSGGSCQSDSWSKPSGGGNSGNGGSGGGYHDDSDNEDNTSRRSPTDDFRDDDFDSDLSKKPGQQQSSFRDNPIASEAKPATVNAVPFATKPAASRTKKPIDLGAAAAFAAQQKPSQLQQQHQAPEHQYNPIVADLFAADDEVPSADPRATTSSAKNVVSSLSFDEDDFNPRDSANAMNNNGTFGDFSAAFSTNDNQHKAENDDFADFSSAFGAKPATFSPAATTPTAIPAPAAPSSAPMFDLFTEAPAEKVSTFDLLLGLDMTSAGGSGIGAGFSSQIPSNPGSNFGGLGELNFSPPPPLIGAPMTGLGSASIQQSSLFDFDPSPASFGAPPMNLQPINNFANNNKSSPPTPSSVSSSSSNVSKKPTTWDAVAGVNIDLDNLRLGGQNVKKTSLPMNKLMTPTSSPTKGFPNEPPQMMKPSNANNLL